jgi:hypothetical protein
VPSRRKSHRTPSKIPLGSYACQGFLWSQFWLSILVRPPRLRRFLNGQATFLVSNQTWSRKHLVLAIQASNHQRRELVLDRLVWEACKRELRRREESTWTAKWGWAPEAAPNAQSTQRCQWLFQSPATGQALIYGGDRRLLEHGGTPCFRNSLGRCSGERCCITAF